MFIQTQCDYLQVFHTQQSVYERINEIQTMKSTTKHIIIASNTLFWTYGSHLGFE